MIESLTKYQNISMYYKLQYINICYMYILHICIYDDGSIIIAPSVHKKYL